MKKPITYVSNLIRHVEVVQMGFYVFLKLELGRSDSHEKVKHESHSGTKREKPNKQKKTGFGLCFCVNVRETDNITLLLTDFQFLLNSAPWRQGVKLQSKALASNDIAQN